MVIELIGIKTEVLHLFADLFLVRCKCGCDSIYIYSLKDFYIKHSIECIHGDNKIGYLHYVCPLEEFINHQTQYN